MGDLKHQKKKAMEVYEQLEQDLTKFEMEEEEEILKLMSQEDQSDDEDIPDGKAKGEIRISDQNMFDTDQAGPAMANQEPELDDYDARMKEIQDKIDEGQYYVDDDIDEPEKKDKADLFFATEIDPEYVKERQHQSS